MRGQVQWGCGRSVMGTSGGASCALLGMTHFGAHLVPLALLSRLPDGQSFLWEFKQPFVQNLMSAAL